MRSNFQACMGFVLDPDNDGQPYHVDSGGPTAWGVTAATWSRWIGRPATAEDMKVLTPQATVPMYNAWYWVTIAGDSLPIGLDLLVFDHGVNAGQHESGVLLQEVLGFTGANVDGAIGPHTLAAVQDAALGELIDKLAVRQEQFYRSLRQFDLYGHGWINRLDRRHSKAIAMLAPPQV